MARLNGKGSQVYVEVQICYQFTAVDVLLQAITDISNGILRDSRVFHMDCPDWTEKYNRQGNLLFLLR